VADVVDHPLGHQELCQLRQAPGGERQVVLGGLGLGDLLDLPALGQSELRRPTTLVPRIKRGEATGVELWITSRTRSSLVNATFAIPATSMPCAESNTICARRHVTTEPLPRRTMRARRRPSSSSISRTLRRSVTGSVSTISARTQSRPAERTRRANVRDACRSPGRILLDRDCALAFNHADSQMQS
jgi:hypothetical protein